MTTERFTQRNGKPLKANYQQGTGPDTSHEEMEGMETLCDGESDTVWENDNFPWSWLNIKPQR